MPIIKLDDKTYDLDKISVEARAQVEKLFAADEKIKGFQKDLTVAQAKRNVYAQSVKALLQNEPTLDPE